MTLPTETTYALGTGAQSKLCAVFTPSGSAWQMQIRAAARGKRTPIVLLETGVTRPLATITLGGESFPLPIGWHERKRGGVLCVGGERRAGIGGGLLEWEMRWMPDASCPGRFTVEMRVRATPRRTGDLRLCLHPPLRQPDVWTLGAASLRGHCAQAVRSPLTGQAMTFVALEEDAGWDSEKGGFALCLRRFPLGGGKCVRFSLALMPAPTEDAPRAPLVLQYAALAGATLHPLASLPPLDPQPAAAYLSDPAHYAAPGIERLYLAPPGADATPLAVYAGAPHYPLDALTALGEWNRVNPNPDVPRLVRGGASGIAADCQVLGQGADAQPNKGAFWDKVVGGQGTDARGEATHGLAANARMARALFLLHEATGERLLRQSALNICEWLILKMNDGGWYDGARVHATRGAAIDGRLIPQPCALDGAEAIRPFVLAFRATRNEVYIKAAWKLAHHLLARMAEFDAAPPPQVAAVLLSLLALDGEAPNTRLRDALGHWGAWLRALPLAPALPGFNADGLHSGLYDCAHAGFALFAHTRDVSYLRYALAALAAVPPASRSQSWRTLNAHRLALLSLAGLLPQAQADFDRSGVSLEWRAFAPDPAAHQYIDVQGEGGVPVHFLPLVCRANDQLLLLVLAPPDVERVVLLKNGRRPLALDLLTGTHDTKLALHRPGGEGWARVGVFTVDA